MALWLLARLVVVALKVAVVAAAGTVTEAGRERAGALLDSVTAAPPMGAALLKVTVQVAEALAPRLAGVQTSDCTGTAVTGRIRIRLTIGTL
jgi:hypothetical protein